MAQPSRCTILDFHFEEGHSTEFSSRMCLGMTVEAFREIETEFRRDLAHLMRIETDALPPYDVIEVSAEDALQLEFDVPTSEEE